MSPPCCDFCSSPDVRWAYPCRDFVREDKVLVVSKHETTGRLKTGGINLTSAMSGGWASCPPCHALIERGLRDSLVRRATRKLQAAGHLPDVPPAQVARLLRPLHDTFWANREGPPVPTSPTTTEDPTR